MAETSRPTSEPATPSVSAPPSCCASTPPPGASTSTSSRSGSASPTPPGPAAISRPAGRPAGLDSRAACAAGAPAPPTPPPRRPRSRAGSRSPVLLVAIWALTGAGYFWPIWPILGTALRRARRPRAGATGAAGSAPPPPILPLRAPPSPELRGLRRGGAAAGRTGAAAARAPPRGTSAGEGGVCCRGLGRQRSGPISVVCRARSADASRSTGRICSSGSREDRVADCCPPASSTDRRSRPTRVRYPGSVSRFPVGGVTFSAGEYGPRRRDPRPQGAPVVSRVLGVPCGHAPDADRDHPHPPRRRAGHCPRRTPPRPSTSPTRPRARPSPASRPAPSRRRRRRPRRPRGSAGWAALGSGERAGLLKAGARALRAARRGARRAPDPRERQAARRTRAGGVDAGIGAIEQYAELGPTHRGRSLAGDRDATDLMVFEPRGVVALLVPWNDPVAIACGQLAAALVTGNTVVLKPSEKTPLSAAADRRAARPSRPGSLNVLLGDARAGRPLAAHPRRRPRDAHWARWPRAGEVAAACAGTGRKALLELGGKDAADRRRRRRPGWAAAQAATGAFANAGQHLHVGRAHLRPRGGRRAASCARSPSGRAPSGSARARAGVGDGAAGRRGGSARPCTAM